MSPRTRVIAKRAGDVLGEGSLSRDQAEAIYDRGKAAVVFALLDWAKQLAEVQCRTGLSATPSTPSGLIPIYEKRSAKRRGQKRPGAKAGHAAWRRKTPERIDWQIEHHAQRLVKRLRRHRGDLLTFLDRAGVPFDNNHAERSIRPAVILRKNSYGNRSQRGAACRAVLMGVFRTLQQRGHDPIQTVVLAIEHYLAHKQIPSPPTTKSASDG